MAAQYNGFGRVRYLVGRGWGVVGWSLMCQDQVGCRFAVAVGGAYLQQQWDCGVCACFGSLVKECCRYAAKSTLVSENNERIRNPNLLVSSCVKEWTAERDVSLWKREWCLALASGRVKKSKSVVQRDGLQLVCKEWLAKSLALTGAFSAYPSLFWVTFGSNIPMEPWKSPQSISNALCSRY